MLQTHKRYPVDKTKKKKERIRIKICFDNMAVDLSNIGRTGYGLMGLTWNTKPPSQEQAFAAMKAAIKNGCIYWNGGEFYGPYDHNSCHLLREYFTKYPEDAPKVIINIKGGAEKDTFIPNGKRDNVRRSVEACVEALGGTHKLDVFECARVDPNTPIEETIGHLAELVKEGKIGAISLSEVKAETIRRAVKVHPIASVEAELSLWAPDILHNGVASTCAELGIPIIAYSPIARGALTKRLTFEDIPEGDFRKILPRFQPDTLKANNRLTDEVIQLAEKKKCTPAQIAVSWVRTLSGRNGLPTIIPIPGATTAERVEENSKHIPLTEEDMAELDEILKKIEIIGERYPGGKNSFMEG